MNRAFVDQLAADRMAARRREGAAERLRGVSRGAHHASSAPFDARLLREVPITSETVRIGTTTLTIRPIEVNDVDRLERLCERLSPESVLHRFLAPIPRLPRSAMLYMAVVDHKRRDALVALDGDEIVGVARYHGLSDRARSGAREAELAVTVEDAWQRRGLGRTLTSRLAVLARERGYDTFLATILPDNRAALGLMRDLVPDATVRFEGGDYRARLSLLTHATPPRDRELAVAGGPRWSSRRQ